MSEISEEERRELFSDYRLEYKLYLKERDRID
jgi:hypothetical protein